MTATATEDLRCYLRNAEEDLAAAEACTGGRREHKLHNVREDLENAAAEVQWLLKCVRDESASTDRRMR